MNYHKLSRLFYKKCVSIIAPKLKYSQSIFEEILYENCQSDYVWLDLGCGHQLLPFWRYRQEQNLVNKSKSIIGLDYDYNSLIKHRTIKNKVRGDISNLPFSSSSFDMITSNMVFEHLNTPEIQLNEIFRILKSGGRLIIHTPNVFGYTTIMAKLIPESVKDKIVYLLQGREEEDVFPAHYKINTIKRIKKLANQSGFRTKMIKMICSSAQLYNIPPAAILELLWIRFLMIKQMKWLRTNIIAILDKP